MKEIEPVHLGLDQPPVAVLRSAEPAPVDGGEAAAEVGETRGLRGHRRCAIVGAPGDDCGMIERAPVGEQPDQGGVPRGLGRDRKRRRRRLGGRGGAERQRGKADGNPFHGNSPFAERLLQPRPGATLS